MTEVERLLEETQATISAGIYRLFYHLNEYHVQKYNRGGKLPIVLYRGESLENACEILRKELEG